MMQLNVKCIYLCAVCNTIWNGTHAAPPGPPSAPPPPSAAAAEAAVKAAKELKWYKGQQLLAQEMQKYHGPHYLPPPLNPSPPPTSGDPYGSGYIDYHINRELDKLPEGWRASVDPVTKNPVWVHDKKE
jgi:hypothetical protein